MDSRIDTYQHIARVQHYLGLSISQVVDRMLGHDRSKLESPEVEMYDEIVPRLAIHAYGSEEYKATLREMKDGLAHHYRCNRHHPEHWDQGVRGMTVIDLLEMVCDWIAASERGKKSVDGDRYSHDWGRNLQINQERFGLSDDLVAIIRNTIRALGAESDPDPAEEAAA